MTDSLLTAESMEQLVCAIEAGDVNTVEGSVALLRARDFVTTLENGNTLLHYVFSCQSVKIIELFITKLKELYLTIDEIKALFHVENDGGLTPVTRMAQENLATNIRIPIQEIQDTILGIPQNSSLKKIDVTPIESSCNKLENFSIRHSIAGLAYKDCGESVVNNTIGDQNLEHQFSSNVLPPPDAHIYGTMKSSLDSCFEYKWLDLTVAAGLGAAMGMISPTLLVPLIIIGSFSIGVSIPFSGDHSAYILGPAFASSMTAMRFQDGEKLGVVKAAAITDLTALAMTAVGALAGQSIKWVHEYLTYDDY